MAAPEAVKLVVLPAQITVPLFTTVMVLIGGTVMVTVRVVEQEPLVPVTLYVVVTAGEAVTTAPLVELRPVAGDQA